MFQQLNAEEGITIFLVTHDAGVARIAERVIHIHDGVIQSISTGTDDLPGAGQGSRDKAPSGPDTVTGGAS